MRVRQGSALGAGIRGKDDAVEETCSRRRAQGGVEGVGWGRGGVGGGAGG